MSLLVLLLLALQLTSHAPLTANDLVDNAEEVGWYFYERRLFITIL